MIDEDWQGFNTAFAEAVRPDDPSGRSGKRMLAVGAGAVLVMAIVALVMGAFDWGPAPGGQGHGYRTEPRRDRRRRAGRRCGTGDHLDGRRRPDVLKPMSTFTAYGYYTAANNDGTTGWATSSAVATPATAAPAASSPSRCRGTRPPTTTAVSPSGSLISARSSPTRHAVCPRTSPRDPDARRSAATPPITTTTGLITPTVPKPRRRGYLVHQLSKQGTWVTNKSFDVTTGKVTLKLVDAGAKDDDAAVNAHVAAAQVRLTCRAT
ncbi:hypothetical protein NKH18_15190 [Streptomyces sp. M10(2022)]